MTVVTFVHTPRPPTRSEAPYQNQLHYGGYEEVRTRALAATVRVFRFAGDPIELTTRAHERGVSIVARVEISATQARDLACRLIDAAADVETEALSAAQTKEVATC